VQISFMPEQRANIASLSINKLRQALIVRIVT